jgi:predicted RNase H-related nuclease YkuK (DUF458 family)
MIESARKAILNSSESSSVYIGCDSLVYTKKGKNLVKYSVVIILHLDSKHGGRIFHETKEFPNYGNLKQRLLKETEIAIDTVLEIIDVIGNRKLSVHLDLNASPEHKSNIAVREALGWVKGATGIDAQIKPGAWAASNAADYVVRK